MNDRGVELSIVIPALNEQDNVAVLVKQVDESLRSRGIELELVIVDDGSTDQTRSRLLDLQATCSWLVIISHAQRQGQSAAMHAGILAAHGRLIATLDADLQNDPADLNDMLRIIQRDEADLVQGDRSHDRRDNVVRRVGSVVGRLARRLILGDPVRDTGCSARVMRGDIARQLPLQFRGMHRFIPAYARVLGARIVEVRVHHRPRHAGQTKYGLGVLNRATAGLFDCLAVRWMAKRYCDTTAAYTKEDAE